MDEQKIQTLDKALVQASKKIKVLNALAWPAEADEQFLRHWRQGNTRLPEVKLAPPDVSSQIAGLEAIKAQCDQQDPAEKFIADTAESYANAGRMLQSTGTLDFTRYSIVIYGRPDKEYKHQKFTPTDAAKFFLDITDDLLGHPHVQPTEFDIPSNEFAGWLQSEVDEFFEQDVVKVVLDSSISSKALAGASRIRVRGNTQFSQLDKDQLLYHEAFVHTATQLNGKKQTNLTSLGLGAPRTTRTQEGIAVLAELITNAIDIVRLRRVALRVLAVKMALDGADFVEVFRFFIDSGQPEIESVRSAQRIFRGGAVGGGVVFTKDAVYLPSLLEVHTFLRLAIRDNRPDLVRNLFAGRLTMADALRFTPLFESGWLKPPVYVPVWATDLRRLAAMMAYSAFVSNIKLENLHLERVFEIEEE